MLACRAVWLATLLLLTLSEQLSALSLGTRLGSAEQSGSPQSELQCHLCHQQRCLAERKEALRDARRYYKARYEAKLILFEIRVHRQRLVEKRLRYERHLQRLRQRYTARILRRIARFKNQALKAKRKFKKKLKKLSIRFRWKVFDRMKGRRRKPISKASRIQLRIRQSPSIHSATSKPAAIITRKLSIAAAALLAGHKRHTGIGKGSIGASEANTKSSHKKGAKRSRYKTSTIEHLQAKTSVREKKEQLKAAYAELARRIHRTLRFRRSIHRIRAKRRFLAERLRHLMARARVTNEQIRTTKAKSERTQLSREALMSIRRLRIRKLRRRRLRLKRCIARVLEKRHRLWVRFHLFQRLIKLQVRAANGIYRHLASLIARWKIYDKERYLQMSKVITRFERESGCQGLHKGSTDCRFTVKSQSAIDRLMRIIRTMHSKLIHLSIQNVISRQRLKRIDHRIQKRQAQVVKLLDEVRTSRWFKRVIMTRHIMKFTKELKQLKTESTEALKAKKRSIKMLLSTALRYRFVLIKHKMFDFVQAIYSSRLEFQKVRQRILRRKRRRKMLLIEKNNLIHKIARARARGASKRAIRRLVKIETRRVIRIQRKRIAKRVIRTVRRIQIRVKQEVRKAARIRRYKRHIERRVVRLGRRAHRITVRRLRVRQQIGKINVKRKLLLTRVNDLKLKRAKIQQKVQPGPFAATQIKRIDYRITRVVRRIAVCTTRVSRLRHRRVQLKIQLRKIALKQRRLRRRVVRLRIRIRRQKKRLHRLVVKEQRFVKRAIKKRLISPWKIVRVIKRAPRIVRRAITISN